MSFDHVVTDIRSLYKEPHPQIRDKAVGRIDEVTAKFIARSPFVLVGTASLAGPTDVSPRGGPPGFVQVLDETRIAIPDLNGNNRLDSLQNIVERPYVGLLFLVPEEGETLRVNGRACITTDPAILDGFTEELRRPTAAIGIDVEECYIHCAKALRRSRLWDPTSWAIEGPSPFDVIKSHYDMDVSPEEIAADLELAYEWGLNEDRPV